MLSEKPWNLERAVYLIVGVLACFLLLSVEGILLQHSHGHTKLDENSLLELILATMSLQGSVIFATAIFLALQGIRWGDAFGFTTHRLFLTILLGVGTAILFLPVGEILQNISIYLVNYFHIKQPPQAAVTTLDAATTPVCRTYLITFYILIGPFGEEILFRGILYPLIKQTGWRHAALWITSLTFAAMHLNWAIFLPLTFLSMVLIWLYEKTDNLLAPFTMHSAFNAMQVAVMYYQSSAHASHP